MNLNLECKLAVVTGAARGIGAAIARGFVDEGASVLMIDMNDDVAIVAAELGVESLVCDLTQPGADKSVAAAAGKLGGASILVNNAGIAVGSAIEDVSMEDAMYQFEVNLFGVGKTVKAVLPHMRSKGSGTIINISSVLGKAYNPLYGWYVSSKHALEGWSDVLRLEVKQFGIDVVIIEPGLIKTNISNASAKYYEKYSKNSEYKNFYIRYKW